MKGNKLSYSGCRMCTKLMEIIWRVEDRLVELKETKNIISEK
jgi:hypothetical protein